MHSVPRRSFFGLSATAAALGLAACNSSGPSSQPEAVGDYTPPPTDLKAELRYAMWDQNQEPAMQEIIQEFNKKYPNIKVTIDLTAQNYWTKIQTEANGNNLPDVFWMNPLSIQLYVAGKQLMPLTGLVKSGAIEEANYTKPVWDIYNVDGIQYGVPKDNDAMGIWYSKKLLQKYDVDPPNAQWKWADLQGAFEQIHKKSNGKMFGFDGPVDQHGNHSWYNSVYQAGGYILSPDKKTCGYDQPGTVEGVKFWRDMISNGYMPSIKQLTDTPFDAWFTSGRTAMIGAGVWQTQPFSAALKDDLGVAPWSSGSAGNPVCVSGLSNVIPANAKNPQASLAFVEFLGNEKSAQIQAKAGVVIPAYKSAQDPFFESIPGLDLSLFQDAIANGFSNPATKNTQAWQKAELDALLPVFEGEADLDATCQSLTTKINDLLAKE